MEVCVDNLQSVQNAMDGGAIRLELCSALSEGGLTPTPGFVRQVTMAQSFSLSGILTVDQLPNCDLVLVRKPELDALLLHLHQTSICNYSCQACPHCTLIFLSAG